MGLFSNFFNRKAINAPDAPPVLANTTPLSSGGSFEMTIEDVFQIKGRGTIATGKVRTGSATVGQ